MSNRGNYLLLDIGGTWLKGMAIDADEYESRRLLPKTLPGYFEQAHRVPSGADDPTGSRFVAALKSVAEKCGDTSSYKYKEVSVPCLGYFLKHKFHDVFS